MIGDGPVGNEIDFETYARLDQDPVKFLSEVFTAGVLGRTSNNKCKDVLNLLQFGDILFV